MTTTAIDPGRSSGTCGRSVGLRGLVVFYGDPSKSRVSPPGPESLGLDDEGEIAQVNAELTARFEASGQGLISSTRLDGRYALRLCVMNHTSSAEDVKRTICWLAEIPVLHGASKPGHGQRARTARRPAAPRLAPALGTDRGS
jgi:hypothetical protein